jgi:hypothetical protein
MTQADCVHSTPPTNTPIDKTRRNFIAQVAAVTAAGGALGMTLPLPAAPAEPVKIDAVRDPIFAAIEAHRRARAEFLAAIAEHGRCEESIPRDRRQSNVDAWEEVIVETDDPRWIAAEKNTKRTSNLMDDRAIDLTTVRPTTIAGFSALLSYVTTVEEEGDGDIAWPDNLVDDDEDEDKPAHIRGKRWACYLHRSLADSLQAMVDGGQA